MLTSIVRRAPVRALVACALLSLVAACATRPPATALDRLPSHALPANTATPLRDALAAQQAAHPGDSGFHLLANGADALQMRIALARAATRTLDLQYYIAEEDTTGKLLLGAALHAAERGVRVRLLVDDLNFHDAGRVMAALDAHPNIEIRLFNPFGATQQSMFRRTSHFITRIERFSHRMHNKAMIADNQLAIVGGRNLGDEYFSASPTVQFLDLDVLAAGPVTRDISASFDTYWASTSSYPLSYLNRQVFDPADLDAMRDELRAHWHTYADPYNAQPLNATPLAQQIGRGELGLEWAPAEFKVDPPDKVVRATEGNAGPPMRRLVELTRVAQTEFLAFSPYFVPHDAGVEILGQMTGRGVRVAILTNSLAATDAVAVQAGYGPYRVPMLERGIELHEFKARPILRPTLFGSHSRASLHAKSYVIDRKILVIGSMNLDSRSAYLNTELALVIHSPALAQQVAAIFERATQPSESYRVLLATPAERSTVGGDSELIWKGMDGSTPQTFHVDPNAGLLRNVLTGLFMMLPIDDEL